MKKLEQLPEIAARQLGGLEATPALLAKIKLKAAEERTPRKPAWKSVAALATAFVLLAVGAVSWQFLPKETSSGDGELMHTRSAGVEIRETEVPVTADLPSGSITLGDGRKGSSDSLFASADNGVFPMLIVNGATYRMLTYPDGISDGLLGSSLGTVNEYNVEPALGSGSIVSNSASQGETVYEIDGFSGALAAAKVNGSTRVFQRVSYAGTATIGNEGLNDTLCSASQVELDDAGRGRHRGRRGRAGPDADPSGQCVLPEHGHERFRLPAHRPDQRSDPPASGGRRHGQRLRHLELPRVLRILPRSHRPLRQGQ